MAVTFEFFAASGSLATLCLPSNKLLRLGDMGVERPVSAVRDQCQYRYCFPLLRCLFPVMQTLAVCPFIRPTLPLVQLLCKSMTKNKIKLTKIQVTAVTMPDGQRDSAVDWDQPLPLLPLRPSVQSVRNLLQWAHLPRPLRPQLRAGSRCEPRLPQCRQRPDLVACRALALALAPVMW